MSLSSTACFLTSDRVRWWLFAGTIGRTRAPDKDAMPPASLWLRDQPT